MISPALGMNAQQHPSAFVVAIYFFCSATESERNQTEMLPSSQVAPQHTVCRYPARSKACLIFPLNRLVSDSSFSSVLLFVYADGVH